MFFRKLNWNVVGWFKVVSAISYAIIAIGLLAMVVHTVQRGAPLRFGLSFTGGTDVTVKFNRSVEKPEIVSALSGIGVTDANVNTLTKSGDTGTPRWTLATQKDFGNNTGELWGALGKIAPIDRTQSEISAVGPSLSREYLIKALWALLIAITIQFVYIAFRFGWNYIFGLVTIVALLRDSAMMIGIYALADKRVDDAFLAAVLTVIGYSVMDTIVILDRIRENTKLMANEPYDKIVNTSILQTMSRSVNTLATVVITLVALLAFGGASLQNFAFALLVGICSGGYHSIFYSAPLVTVMRKRQLEAIEKRRALGAPIDGKPRTVADARRQGARSEVEREAIVAARRERRDKERSASQRGTTGPAKYKRRRPTVDPLTGAGAVETIVNGDVVSYEEMDPLDAQDAGLHDRSLEMGHEEITMNLDPLDHDITHAHADHDHSHDDHAHDHADHDHAHGDHTHDDHAHDDHTHDHAAPVIGNPSEPKAGT